MKIFCLIMLGGLAYVNVAHPVYESNGSLLVKFGNEAVPEVNAADRKPDELSQNDRREMIESNIQILKSHDLLLEVVNELTPDIIYPGITQRVGNSDSPVEAAINGISKSDLEIKAGQQSNVIEIKMSNRNPQVAALFLHRLIDVFIQRYSDVYNNPHATFLEEQVEKAGKQLADSQKELQDFKAREGVSSIDEELTRLIQQKGEADTIAFQAVGDAQSRLAELKAKEAILLGTYKPDSNPVQQLRQSIAEAERELHERQADLKPQVNDLNAGSHNMGKNNILGTHILDINRKIDELEKQRSRYNDLVRQVKINEDNYTNYVKHSEDARINETLNNNKVTRISVLDEPVAPIKPVRPNKLLIVVSSLIAAIVASLGIALLIETFDERFAMPEQVSPVLGLPVMATFSLTGKK